jgi:hypothetical protein
VVIGGFLLVMLGLAQPVLADEFEDFTYVDEGVTITITDYPTEAVGAVVIPAEIVGKPVTAIGAGAFQFCSGITSVSVPGSVTSIGAQAFFGCSAMVSINLPAGLTVLGDSAFEGCLLLGAVTVPSGMTSLGNNVFLSCEAMTTVSLPGTLTSLGANVFFNCKSLTAIEIPVGVTSIGGSAFRFCESLTSIEIPVGVTEIPFGCFSDCAGLEEIILPAGVTVIGGSAFANCASLPGLVIPATVTSIGTFAFARCGALESLVIPNGVQVIGSNFFELCTSLTSITLPSSATTIGNNAFLNCRALTSVSIPAGVFSIGTDAFGLCLAMTSIVVDPANPFFSSSGGVLFNKQQTQLISYPRGLGGAYEVPVGVTGITSGAFRFAGGVTSIDIPASLTTIGGEAFAGCGALMSFTVAATNTLFNTLNGVLTSKSTLSLLAFPGGRGGVYAVPSGVTTIGASAFRYNTKLTGIVFPVGIVTVRDNAASNCPLLGQVTFLGNAPGTVGITPFDSAAQGFKVFHQAGSTGFTNPWRTYPTEVLPVGDPYESWLAGYGLPAGSPLGLDSNGDGVSLLMAYALDLDPRENLSGEMPKAVVTATQMSLSYSSEAEGVTYVVEASEDLEFWSSAGVTLTGPDVNGVSTATVARGEGSLFLRLVVSYSGG